MGWIVAIIVGAIIGWLASSVMGEREGLEPIRKALLL